MFFQSGCLAKDPTQYTCGGILGLIVGGELVNALGAGIFITLRIGWPAVMSLAFSLVSLFGKMRPSVKGVAKTKLHTCDESVLPTDSIRSVVELWMPGPLTFARYLLIVPVWPMTVEYIKGGLSKLCITLLSVLFPAFNGEDELSDPSTDAIWVDLRDWSEIAVPFRTSDNDSPLSFVQWAIAPHVVWTLLSSVWLLLVSDTYVAIPPYTKSKHAPLHRRLPLAKSQRNSSMIVV